MIRVLALAACLAILFISVIAVLGSPVFSSWENKHVAEYYIENGMKETGSSNIVSAIVWDLRGFDTLGEETVLFTAAACISAVIIFGLIGRKK